MRPGGTSRNSRVHPAPAPAGEEQEERPDHPRTLVIREDFDRDATMADFSQTLRTYVLARP